MKPLSRYITLAKKESQKSLFKRFQVGAVLVRKKKVIGRGYNRNKTHTELGSGFSSTLHAEGSAIQDALKNGIDPKGCVIYIFRRNGNLSAPCEDCRALLVKFGISSVVYTKDHSEERIEL